jgi:predicted NUDIX family NTP pyrophosphohydrolase
VAKLAAGILLYRRPPGLGRPEVLLVLSRSSAAARSRRSRWSIPKGKPQRRERLIDAARREFHEETARHAPAHLVELGEIVEPSGKRVAVWAAHTEWSETDDGPDAHECAPDIADIGWFDSDQAQDLLRPGQAPLLSRLERLVETEAG